MSKRILVTGAAGFIGFHLVNQLLERGDTVVGLDSLNDYYNIQLKKDRIRQVGIESDGPHAQAGQLIPSNTHENYSFVQVNLNDREVINQVFDSGHFDAVVNLAAQAGVRYSLENPQAYIDSNIVGFANILEACRHHQVGHLVYASSSSVYGLNETMPFSVENNVDHPVSLYAASKKSNELMAHTYSHLFNLPTTGLRFFTVYGPWGRPDMALFLFTDAILKGKPINIFNHGKMKRDFTYVDDIVGGTIAVIDHPPKGNENWNGLTPDPSSSKAPYKIYNIGNNEPVELMKFIKTIEEVLGKEAEKNFMDIQPGDVPATYADVQALSRDVGYHPGTPLKQGITAFIDWFLEYYGK
ncbi:MAG: NAD-dependent epimerase [Bacteroidota bacterium]